MTKEQFDNYIFSIHTEVRFLKDEWDKITEVDFARREVGVERGIIVSYEHIEEIRN